MISNCKIVALLLRLLLVNNVKAATTVNITDVLVRKGKNPGTNVIIVVGTVEIDAQEKAYDGRESKVINPKGSPVLIAVDGGEKVVIGGGPANYSFTTAEISGPTGIYSISVTIQYKDKNGDPQSKTANATIQINFD